MKNQIMLILLSMVLTACSSPTQSPAPIVETSEVGRFQLVALGTMRRDHHLLDTKTGKIWSRQCWVGDPSPEKCKMTAWTAETVENVTHTVHEILEMAERVENKKGK